MPIYRAEATLRRSLESIRRQTTRDFELVLVDSGPDSECRQIASEVYPEANYLKLDARRLPHDACNLGIGRSSGDILVFTDPDAYAEPDWLERLLGTYYHFGGAVVGAVGCHEPRVIDLGAHLCKFDKWLPGGSTHLLEEGPTVNFLIGRPLFERFGPFPAANWHADTDLSWRLRQAGVEIRFEPKALVYHHHLHSWPSLLAERFTRGMVYADFWPDPVSASRTRLVLLAARSFLPLRLFSQLLRVWSHARASGMAGAYLRSFHIVSSGLYAWLLGETLTYARRLARRTN